MMALLPALHRRFVGALLFASLAPALCAGVADDAHVIAEKPHFTPLKYNSEGTTYMKAGLCSSAVVGDFDGDGDDDVYLAAAGNTLMGGTWYFENASPAGAKGAPTAFRPRVRRGHCGGGIRCTLADGTSAVVAGRKVNYRFEKDPAAFEPFGGSLPANVHYGKVRANYWRLRDFDGDGRDVLFLGRIHRVRGELDHLLPAAHHRYAGAFHHGDDIAAFLADKEFLFHHPVLPFSFFGRWS